VFPDPRELTRTLLPSGGGASCPSCGRASLLDHVNATVDQIKALGFTSDAYQ